MIFVYSDLHLYHTNIGFYCNRPRDFSELIIKRHNEIVRDDDTILNLGDLGFTSATGLIKKAVAEMKGKQLIMVKGNHDKSAQWLRDCGADHVLQTHGDSVTVEDSEYRASIICAVENADPRALVSDGVVVSHEPLSNIKWPYLFGHVHNNPVPWDHMDRPYPISAIQGRNVCIEMLNYMPVPLPFLINDEKWIAANYQQWFLRLFNYSGKRKRQDIRARI